MTEREAWLYLANKWKNVNKTFGCRDRVYVRIVGGAGGTDCYGLCGCLDTLRIDRHISWHIYDRMKKRIKRHRYYVSGCYLWDWTFEGAKKRANFCKLQAAKLRKKS